MKYMVKGIVWIVLITIGLLLGLPLLIGFVWWKVLIFGIASQFNIFCKRRKTVIE